MDFLIKQVKQIATNRVGKQLDGTEQRNHIAFDQLVFDIKTAFYIINSTANQYFERSWTIIKWYRQSALNNSK